MEVTYHSDVCHKTPMRKLMLLSIEHGLNNVKQQKRHVPHVEK